MWTIDVDTGVVSVPSTGKRYEAEHSKITGRAGMYNSFLQNLLYVLSLRQLQPSPIVNPASANAQYKTVSSNISFNLYLT